mmetsp:Transcript_7409/g.15900  ORF Transcript_7409/g.15900 Transcript_7409/m.15900 type:complete len:356 (+) Transcript_7409:143-1210(+)
MMAMKLQTATLGGKRMASSTPIQQLFRSSTFYRAGVVANPAAIQGRRKTVAFLSSTSTSSSTSFFGRLWARYTEALIARPLLVKGGAASLIFLVSDSATQRLMNGPEAEWDGSRALSGAGFGVVATCWLHYWWGFLEVVINKRLPVARSKFINALAKVVADQLVGAPLYIYSYYCITHFGKEWMAIRNNNNDNDNDNHNQAEKTNDDGKEQVRAVASSSSSSKAETATTAAAAAPDVTSLMKETSDRALEMLPDTILRHWTLWPIVHTLNFYYNPLHHRVLVQNIVLIFWSGYLSHLNNGGLVTPEKEVEMTVQRKKTKIRGAAAGLSSSSCSEKGETPLATSPVVRTAMTTTER